MKEDENDWGNYLMKHTVIWCNTFFINLELTQGQVI
jgi:hypothetical protein